eukprot:SAG31_NODE_1948_length_6834_cov_16.124276_3_plen_56_part_00
MASQVKVISAALMWLIHNSNLPWILPSTQKLAPALHRMMLQAQQRFGDIRQVRWR